MDIKKLDIGYKFKDINLLETAFTHLSYSNENCVESYERLEYLGDSVLQLIVSEFLYNNFPELESGELSKYRSHLVSTKNLSSITKKLHFDYYIKIGKALTSISDALMADLFESVLASIYLDGGIIPAKEFVLNQVVISKQNVVSIFEKDKDYKTELQELLQAKKPTPKLEYILLDSEQKNNKTLFKMCLKIDGMSVGEVSEFSKRECERLLSKMAYEKLSK